MVSSKSRCMLSKQFLKQLGDKLFCVCPLVSCKSSVCVSCDRIFYVYYLLPYNNNSYISFNESQLLRILRLTTLTTKFTLFCLTYSQFLLKYLVGPCSNTGCIRVGKSAVQPLPNLSYYDNRR